MILEKDGILLILIQKIHGINKKDNLDHDVRGNINTKYNKINSLDLLCDDISEYLKKD